MPPDYLFNVDLVSGDTRIRKEVTLKVDAPELRLSKSFVKHAGVQSGPPEHRSRWCWNTTGGSAAR